MTFKTQNAAVKAFAKTLKNASGVGAVVVDLNCEADPQADGAVARLIEALRGGPEKFVAILVENSQVLFWQSHDLDAEGTLDAMLVDGPDVRLDWIDGFPDSVAEEFLTSDHLAEMP